MPGNDGADRDRLTQLVRDTLADVVKNVKVKSCHVSIRPPVRSGDTAGKLIQIDIECANAPRRVRIENDAGEVVSTTQRLISDIIILLDGGRTVLWRRPERVLHFVCELRGSIAAEKPNWKFADHPLKKSGGR